LALLDKKERKQPKKKAFQAESHEGAEEEGLKARLLRAPVEAAARA